MPGSLIVDIDGTLVDSNYQHVLAWQRAFRVHEIEAEAWKIHRYIGKGGDQMVVSVAGEDAEARCGDQVRDSEAEVFQELIKEIRPFAGASSFIGDVVDRGYEVILASSAKSDEVDHYLGLLDVGDSISGHTTSADVEATKPEPDLVEAALEKAGTRDALVIGDSIWDVEAARRAGLECLAVLTGGFSKQELRAAGAIEIQPALSDLVASL
jgi:HAD superfamily hydrolase (TIGR01549 family)